MHLFQVHEEPAVFSRAFLPRPVRFPVRRFIDVASQTWRRSYEQGK